MSNHLTAQQIDRIHKQQSAALTGITNKYKELQSFDLRTTKNMKPTMADGREYQKAVGDQRHTLTEELRGILNTMRARVTEVEGARRNWTRNGYMAAYRFANDADDSILSNGKQMAALQDEMTRLRIMQEAKLLGSHELAAQADAAAASGDWGSLRIFAMEASTRSDSKSKQSLDRIKTLLEEVELPSEQADTLTKIDQISAYAENAQKIYFDSVGVKASYLKGEVPKAAKVVKAKSPSAA